MLSRSLAFVLCFLSLLLLPSPSLGQSYSGTATTASYGYYNGSNYLYCFAEFFYDNSGSGAFMWAGNAIKFEVSVTKYYDYAHYQANNPVSTNTGVWDCGNGEWMVQQWNPTTARVSGAKYLSLEQGYYFSVTVTGKAYGSFRPNFYANWGGFSWVGQSQTIQVDTTNPGDG